jgi:glycosyltransferase involved in cell wall biosynthesis
MIWLASFPRSGNTFFRNVLYEVYGIPSSTFHKDPSRPLDENYDKYPVVKTHLLPDQIIPNDPSIKSVYIIRDGRDALVSLAHHRKDIVEPGTDFYTNLLMAIDAPGGSYFGGWSENVRQWTARADIIIRYEDLIVDPLGQAERLRAIMDLPTPHEEKIPTFKQLKFGQPKYGASIDEKPDLKLNQLNFRKGKVGSWKEEMPSSYEEFFWARNSREMEKWKYERKTSPEKPAMKKILIEVSKLFSSDNDGIKRYLAELIQHLPVVIKNHQDWQIDAYFNHSIQSLGELHQQLDNLRATKFHQDNPIEKFKSDHSKMAYENILLRWKENFKEYLPDPIYSLFSYAYRRGPFRNILRKYRNFQKDQKLKTLEKYNFQQMGVYDLVHTPLPQNLQFVKHIKAPHAVTIHDLTHRHLPQHHLKENIALAESGMNNAKNLDAHIIAISKATKTDLLNTYQFEPDKIHMVYEAVNQDIFKPLKTKSNITEICKKYNFPQKPYIMCLSTIEPRKNLTNTAEAFIKLLKEEVELDISLIICGKKGWKVENAFHQEIIDHPHVHFTGFIDDQDLPILYSHAEALCYISFYEGFGLPILEAMSCRTPVIYGNNSSMPEVAGPGGLPADAANIEDIKRQMKRILTEEGLRDQLSKSAWQQAQKFSWLKVAIETLEVYENIIAKKK